MHGFTCITAIIIAAGHRLLSSEAATIDDGKRERYRFAPTIIIAGKHTELVKTTNISDGGIERVKPKCWYFTKTISNFELIYIY